MTGHGNDVNLQKNTSRFEGLKWSELSTHVFTPFSRILDLRIYEFFTKLNVVVYINSNVVQ